MARYKHGERQPREHSGDLDALAEFIGLDLLEHVQRISQVTQQRETLKIAGKIEGGYFTLKVVFNGAETH